MTRPDAGPARGSSILFHRRRQVMQTSPFLSLPAPAKARTHVVGGWEVPYIIEDLRVEVDAALAGAVLSDASPFGRIEVRGADRLDLLHRLSTNDLIVAREGEVRSTVFLTDKGRIVDRVFVLVRKDSLLLMTSAGTAGKLMDWLGKFIITEDISLYDVTAESGLACIMGAQVDSVLSANIGCRLAENTWGSIPIGDIAVTVALVKELHGKRAFLMTEASDSKKLLLHVAGGGFPFGLRPVGYAASEILRICQGIPEGGRELTEEFTPYDVGLRDDISFTKGCYIGQEVIARLDTYGRIRKRPMGLIFPEGATPHPGEMLERGGATVGRITSIAPAPFRGKLIGFAVVADPALPDGSTLTAVPSGATCTAASFPLTA
jgi:folate-binding protein YgfZ